MKSAVAQSFREEGFLESAVRGLFLIYRTYKVLVLRPRRTCGLDWVDILPRAANDVET